MTFQCLLSKLTETTNSNQSEINTEDEAETEILTIECRYTVFEGFVGIEFARFLSPAAILFLALYTHTNTTWASYFALKTLRKT